jgi:hypothetical protein
VLYKDAAKCYKEWCKEVEKTGLYWLKEGYTSETPLTLIQEVTKEIAKDYKLFLKEEKKNVNKKL